MKQKSINDRTYQLTHVLILLLTAVVWGFAFVSQSVGAEYVGAFTFLAIRNWIAVLFLIPVIRVLTLRRNSEAAEETETKQLNRHQKRMYLLAGVSCGTALLCASAAQQIGIAYTTTAKAGFITTLYVVLVPILSIVIGQRPAPSIWISVVIGTAGLYLLCMTPGNAGGINRGDLIMLLCAVLFSVQILLVNHYSSFLDGVRLSFLQSLTCAVIATFLMLVMEKPALSDIRAALPALLYAGVMSSGVGYTLQIIGQKGLDPTIASLVMCLECVFSAVGGWMLLGQRLSARELGGCALMFTAILISILLSGRRKEQA
ncbi:MAG: DMT family transporter [Lachnospiraceae bacterium]|nr:DMT family transporter [Lachnospiraceae bacterium]